MTFLDNLEDKTRAAYLKILERKYPLQIYTEKHYVVTHFIIN
jgi:hypothetical protein